jgi:chorismate mutase/prephenate dehydratase
MDLSELRLRINTVDEGILRLLSERRTVVQSVIDAKLESDLPLRDPGREEDLLAERIARGRELGLDAHLITRVFHEIIDDSVRSQQIRLLQGLNDQQVAPRKVTYQGIDGAYSHLAAKKFFEPLGEGIEFVGLKTFSQVIESVEESRADYAVLPVENTTAGNINDVYDLLLQTRLSIVGEEIFPVRHCLLAVDDVPLSRIRRVLSHPQALAQCMRFLRQLENCQPEYYADTAMAVQKVKADGDVTQAAIASEEAGRLYGLKIIARDLADQRENYTRFVIVAQRPIRVDARIPTKTSMVMATAHHAGALNKALDVLGQHEVNLTKLDSRPKPGSPFEYIFHIDFEGNLEDERIARALNGLRAVTSFLKILGTYPSAQRGKTQPRVEALVTGDTAPLSSSPSLSSLSSPAIVATARAAASDPLPRTSGVAAPSLESSRLARRDVKPSDTVIRVGVVETGRDFFVVAGPSELVAESELREIARQIKEYGGKLLRASCARPGAAARVEPLSRDAVESLARIARQYDLASVTEVRSPDDVTCAAELMDVLLIGARNMQNVALLEAVGKLNRPVILERGAMNTVEEFLDAAEFIIEQGNHQVILCERGIRTFETVTRHTLDLGAIPILRRLTHLPILVNPCYSAAQRDLLVPLALAAHAVEPHGLVLDVGTPGDAAGRESAMSLTLPEFRDVLARTCR